MSKRNKKRKNKQKRWKAKRSLRENVQRRLPVLAEEYFAEGRNAMADGTSWEAMHAFRLRTKRFRYTLELFREAYGPALTRRIDSLKEVQTFLGDINDCVVTSALVAEMAEMASVREELGRKAEKKTARLRAFWQKVFDAPGQAEQWMRYLRYYACRPPRTRTTMASTDATGVH